MKTNRLALLAGMVGALYVAPLMAQSDDHEGGPWQGKGDREEMRGPGGPGGEGMHGGHEGLMGMGPLGAVMNPHVMLELGMSMDQQAKLKAFHDSKKDDGKKLKDDLEKSEAQLKAALLATPVDKTKLDQAKAGLVEAGKKMLDARIEGMTYFMGLLTPEQHKKLEEIITKMEAEKAKRDQDHAKHEQGKDMDKTKK